MILQNARGKQHKNESRTKFCLLRVGEVAAT